MKNIKKLALGVLFASMILISLPSQEAKASVVSFSPPSKEFYYMQPYGSDSWFYTENPAFDESGHLEDAERAITYLSFDVTGSVFEDPSYSSLGNLVLSIHDVVTATAGANGLVNLHRVNDQAVFNAGPGVVTSGVGIAPISLGQYLGQGIVSDLMEDGDVLNIAIINAISSGLANGTPYLSFAVTGNDNSMTYFNTDSASFTTTPAPEPMSLTYILLGCGAFAIRRIKNLLGIA